MPKIQAAFICKSFKEEAGFLSFNSIVQSIRVSSLPALFTEAAIGILITDLPTDRKSSIQVSLMATDGFIELDGQLKADIQIKPTSDGFTQIAYNIKNLVIPRYDAYRFVFSFDGSPEIVHYAPFVVLPLSQQLKGVPSWAKPKKPTRH
jgi:hypothetical protein